MTDNFIRKWYKNKISNYVLRLRRTFQQSTIFFDDLNSVFYFIKLRLSDKKFILGSFINKGELVIRSK